MSEAVKFYPKLKAAFKVCRLKRFLAADTRCALDVGQALVPIAVSLNKTQPYVETNYSLPDYDQCASSGLHVALAPSYASRCRRNGHRAITYYHAYSLYDLHGACLTST